MSTPAEEPSQAARLEGVVEAGMGADDAEHTAKRAGDGSSNGGKSLSPSELSEAVGEDVKKEEKKGETPQSPQRGKFKTALIMLSLCVRVLSLCGN